MTIVQARYKIIDEAPLSGAYNMPDTVPLSLNTWFSGEFQDLYSAYYEYKMGFRPTFIRLHNEFRFRLFNKGVPHVILARENQLYEWMYWGHFRGYLAQPVDTVRERVKRIQELKDHLEQSGVPFMVIIGANKARYMPEYLRANYGKEEVLPNNYKTYLSALDSTDIKVVDFNQVFLDMKPEMGKKMFPNSGTHWSAYGMGLCLDSILSYANRRNPESLKQARVRGHYLADSTLPSDLDLADNLNLLLPYPLNSNLFPEIEIGTSGRKTRIFAIGDSFYWNLYQLDEFFEVADTGGHYWYYNRSEVHFDNSKVPVEQLNPVEIAAHSDIVVIISTEANLDTFPFGFPKDFFRSLAAKKQP